MQKIPTILGSLALIFVLSGCGTDGTTVDDSTNTNNQDTQQTLPTQSAIPPQSQGVGLDYDLIDYLFPAQTLQRGTVSKDFYVTFQDSSGFFTDQKETIHYILEGDLDEFQEPILSIFVNNKIIEQYRVQSQRISVTIYNQEGTTTHQQYPRYIRQNEDLLRTQEVACILKEPLSDFYLSDVLPIQADPNQSSIAAHFTDVLHIYCGTSDGTKVDHYYANGWGDITTITEHPDNSTDYEVFDKNSYQILR